MPSSANHQSCPNAALRRTLLAISVTYDVDVVQTEAGARLAGPHEYVVPWTELVSVTCATTSLDDQQELVYQRLMLHSTIASLGDSAEPLLRTKLRAVALPAQNPLHPGTDWTQEVVPGALLTRGLGVHGIMPDPQVTIPLPMHLANLAKIDVPAAWQEARSHAEEMAGLLMCRIHRDISERQEVITLRPMGGVDVLSLVATKRLRRALAAGDGVGMRAIAVPTRSRGWIDLKRIDPAFVATAWNTADLLDAGVDKPLLVTADEVACSPQAPDAVALLKDEIIDVRVWDRSHRFR